MGDSRGTEARCSGVGALGERQVSRFVIVDVVTYRHKQASSIGSMLLLVYAFSGGNVLASHSLGVMARAAHFRRLHGSSPSCCPRGATFDESLEFVAGQRRAHLIDADGQIRAIW